MNSPWHCTSITKKNTLNNLLARSRMPLKINYPLVPLPWDSSEICPERAVQTTQTCQSKRSFTPFALLTTDCVLCQEANAHLYTVTIVDKIAAVIIISICFWCNVTLAFSVIKCQRLNDWMPVGGAYGEKKKMIHQCLALEAGFMQIFVPEWRHLVPKTQNETFLELD